MIRYFNISIDLITLFILDSYFLDTPSKCHLYLLPHLKDCNCTIFSRREMPRKYGQDLSCATRKDIVLYTMFLKHGMLANMSHATSVLINTSHNIYNAQNTVLDLNASHDINKIHNNLQLNTLEDKKWQFENLTLFEFSEITYTTAITFDTKVLEITGLTTGLILNSYSNKIVCFNLNIILCPSELYIYEYIQIQLLLFYTKLRSSSVLKFYIHFLMSIFTIFDISLQPSMITYKLQYRFQRNRILRHDYIALLQKLSSDCPKVIYPLKFNIILVIRHIQVVYTILLPLNFIVLDIKQLINILLQHNIYKSNLLKSRIIGGGPLNIFALEDLIQYSSLVKQDYQYIFYQYVPTNATSQVIQNRTDLLLISDLSLSLLVSHISIANMKLIANAHNLRFNSKIKLDALQKLISEHICQSCIDYTTIFICIDLNKQSKEASKLKTSRVKQYQASNSEKYKSSNLNAVKQYQSSNAKSVKANNLEAVKKYQSSNSEKYKASNLEAVKQYQNTNIEEFKASNLKAVKKYQSSNLEKIKASNLEAVKKYQVQIKSQFPPALLSESLQHQVISGFCKDTASNVFQEAGCTVCGRLTPLPELQKLSDLNLDLSILCQTGITQKERYSIENILEDIHGPILEENLDNICSTCFNSVSKGKLPQLALANGKWIGKIPTELQNLSYAEQLLIARVRHNRCLIRVSSGMHKMRANVISYANPMPKVYHTLPPPIEELDEVLAFIYTGPCKPTKSDFERIPLLVRRALEWLKLNHIDYLDLNISYENLEKYPENEPPVVVDYKESFENKDPESTAINDMEDESGVEIGSCPFVVHGVTGEEYSTKSLKALKAIALQHLTDNRKVLAIGHEKNPESIYNNPQLFPQMMPWLFPYGLGGIGNSLQKYKSADLTHKRHLLLYHDKRFQKDPHFPLIAFNHEQIKDCTTAGYLLAEKPKFDSISKRLMDVDLEVLSKLIDRMANNELVKPATDEETACFQLIKDLDHVGGFVKGSVTTKKYMRNEIWSLISFAGAPSWFITFAPADNKHPICLYYADTKVEFNPQLRDENERFRLIAQNPSSLLSTSLNHRNPVDPVDSGGFLVDSTRLHYGN